MWILLAVYLFLGTAVVRAKSDVCPEDLVKETQNCFTEMAQAVQLESGSVAQSGTMTLDYKQIKKYCVDGGLISQFVKCVEDLTAHCQNATQTTILDRLVSPARVRAAMPFLCQKQDEIEKAGECMNTVMGQDSQCKNQAYDKVKMEMTKSIRNVTMTFLIQCSFFNSLAACQKEALSKSCGSGLGEVHAHFLLSFIPNSCSDNTTTSGGASLEVSTDSNNPQGSDPKTAKTASIGTTKIVPTQPPSTATRKSEISETTVSGNSNKTEVQIVIKKSENGSKPTVVIDNFLLSCVLYLVIFNDRLFLYI